METLEQLKAQAYDCIEQLEIWQKRLNEINQKIAEVRTKQSQSTEEPKN